MLGKLIFLGFFLFSMCVEASHDFEYCLNQPKCTPPQDYPYFCINDSSCMYKNEYKELVEKYGEKANRYYDDENKRLLLEKKIEFESEYNKDLTATWRETLQHVGDKSYFDFSSRVVNQFIEPMLPNIFTTIVSLDKNKSKLSINEDALTELYRECLIPQSKSLDNGITLPLEDAIEKVRSHSSFPHTQYAIFHIEYEAFLRVAFVSELNKKIKESASAYVVKNKDKWVSVDRLGNFYISEDMLKSFKKDDIKIVMSHEATHVFFNRQIFESGFYLAMSLDELNKLFHGLSDKGDKALNDIFSSFLEIRKANINSPPGGEYIIDMATILLFSDHGDEKKYIDIISKYEKYNSERISFIRNIVKLKEIRGDGEQSYYDFLQFSSAKLWSKYVSGKLGFITGSNYPPDSICNTPTYHENLDDIPVLLKAFPILKEILEDLDSQTGGSL